MNIMLFFVIYYVAKIRVALCNKFAKLGEA